MYYWSNLEVPDVPGHERAAAPTWRCPSSCSVPPARWPGAAPQGPAPPPYAIRNECRSCRRVIKTINSLKRTKRMYRFKVLSERRHLKISSPNWDISKSYQFSQWSKMLNLHGADAQYGHKGSFYKQSFHELWKYIVLEHGPWTLT